MKSEISDFRPPPPACLPPGADDEGFQRRAPTLYVIIAIKLLKFSLFAGLAVCLYAISDDDRPVEYQQVLHFLHVNPERRFWADLAVKVGTLTEANLLWTAVGTLCYSLFSLVEGVGLMFRASWAGWRLGNRPSSSQSKCWN